MTRAGEKMLTTVLASTCGALFVLAVALQFGVGRGYHWLPPSPRPGDVVAGAIDRKPFHLPPESEFAAIDQRPLFNDDRRPAPDEPADTTPDAPPASPLNISLTGTILAAKPEMRMAMVRENGKLETTALREGMPLPGNQSGWTLTRVKSRSAIFKSTAGDEVEVELAMVNPGQNAGPRSRRPPRVPTPARAPHVPPVSAQSEELQRRIEARRRQMREAAERMKAQRRAGERRHQR